MIGVDMAPRLRPPHPRRGYRANRGDLWACVLLVALIGACAATIRFRTAPLEDAAMLMRYAQHLAEGHGLVWNIGDAPVDGATDFLYTLVIAVVTYVAVPVETAARVVSLVSWIVTVGIVYVTARRIHGASVIVASVAATAIIVGTATLYISAGFGTPFFGLWVAVVALLAFRLRANPTHRTAALLFGLAWLFLGLTRPEGVLLGGFILFALVVDLGPARSRQLLIWSLAVMATIGGMYFAWRWSYFGYPLPNPFYKKGGAVLHLDGLIVAARAFVMFGAPFALIWLAALLDPRHRRTAVYTFIPIVLFTACWILLSPEMNYASRFQYAIAVLIAMSWPALAYSRSVVRFFQLKRSRLPALGRTIQVAVVVGVALALVAPTAFYYQRSAGDTTDQRALVGSLLAPFASRGYLVATTEAGLIPLTSGWRALDTWGLNDQTIAHRGELIYADLDRAAPTVVFTHASQAPGANPVPDHVLGQQWTDMTVTVAEWADDRGFELVRSAGRPGASTWNMWVRPGTPDSQRLAELLACRTYVGLPTAASTRVVPISCSPNQRPDSRSENFPVSTRTTEEPPG